MTKTPPSSGTTTTDFNDARVLKAMRAALGLSQESFADLIGMKRQQLSAYENGHHSPGVRTVAEIAAKAGIRLEVKITPVRPDEEAVATACSEASSGAK